MKPYPTSKQALRHVPYRFTKDAYDPRAVDIVHHLQGIEALMQTRIGDELPARIYNELVILDLPLEVTHAYTRYSLERIQRHSQTGIYLCTYYESDKSLAAIPYHLVDTDKDPQSIIEFFALANQVRPLQDFDGNRFTDFLSTATDAITYVRNLTKEDVFVLTLTGGEWQEFITHIVTPDLTDPNIEHRATAQKQMEIAIRLREWERRTELPLIEIYRFLQTRSQRYSSSTK
ncbi:hypothetical protein HY641_04180 [Candidatus Woesearchaeota archaeon]|nr:hypothetical protein [Candidatus Woesearchaeota archaeon]